MPPENALFREQYQAILRDTDRLFGGLLVFQWLALVLTALVYSPRAWAGTASWIHPHVWSATLLGGVAVSFPVVLSRVLPGDVATRHAIALGQMSLGSLAIHLTGGRIETHFHVFGSLAFLAFYLDWRVLATASAFVAIDHFWRGLFWPLSVYGIDEVQPWRWVEHIGWVAFEDVFLIRSCHRSLRALAEVSAREGELARSNADLQQFAHIASHDLQEPLRTVGNYTQYLSERYAGQLDSKADAYISLIVDAVARMQRLISDLLTYSKLGNERRPMVATAMEDALSQALSNLGSAIAEGGTVVTHDVLPTILGDPPQLVRLLQNLVGNAIKYRGDGRPRVHVAARREGDRWHFTVADNGIGIDPSHSERIFEIFQRLHTRDSHPGTGLGLSICKRIVGRHAGSIWVESRPGTGSTFHFTIGTVHEERP